MLHSCCNPMPLISNDSQTLAASPCNMRATWVHRKRGRPKAITDDVVCRKLVSSVSGVRVPNRLMADIDAALEQQVPALPQRERIVDVHHYREADYPG